MPVLGNRQRFLVLLRAGGYRSIVGQRITGKGREN